MNKEYLAKRDENISKVTESLSALLINLATERQMEVHNDIGVDGVVVNIKMDGNGLEPIMLKTLLGELAESGIIYRLEVVFDSRQ